MPKRKLKLKRQTKRKKKSILPDLEDDGIVDKVQSSIEVSSNLLGIDDILESSRPISPVSDDDAELLIGLYDKEVKLEKLKKGDIAWVKHDRKSAYWPAYIKTASGNKIFVCFIGYNKFTKGDRSFSYNVNSKKVKRFYTKEYESLISEGKEFYRKFDKSNRIDESDKGSVSTFVNAVNLAENYIMHRNDKSFKDESEVFEFFRSNGFSLYYKQCIADHNLSPRTRSASALIQSNSTEDASQENSLSIPEISQRELHSDLPSNCFNSQESPSAKADQNCTLSSTKTSPLTGLNDSTATSDESNHLSCKRRLRKNRSKLVSFNKANNSIVKYILDGNCNGHLMDIFSSKVHSKRMDAFNAKWDKESLAPKTKNMPVEETYLEDDQQLNEVGRYLQNLVKVLATEFIGMVKKGDLLFNVFIPEAIIYSIHKVRRKSLPKAETLFKRGYDGPRDKGDPYMRAPLTDEERLVMRKRLEDFARELQIPFTV